VVSLPQERGDVEVVRYVARTDEQFASHRVEVCDDLLGVYFYGPSDAELCTALDSDANVFVR
jgi:hypothetical protein